MNVSDDNELDHQNDQLQHVTLHYIQSGTKSGQDLEFGTLQRTEKPRNFPGTGR